MLTYSRRVFHENSFKLFFCIFLFFSLLAFAKWASFIIPEENFLNYLYLSFLFYSLSQINLLFFGHKTGFIQYCLAVVLPAGIIALLLIPASPSIRFMVLAILLITSSLAIIIKSIRLAVSSRQFIRMIYISFAIIIPIINILLIISRVGHNEEPIYFISFLSAAGITPDLLILILIILINTFMLLSYIYYSKRGYIASMRIPYPRLFQTISFLLILITLAIGFVAVELSTGRAEKTLSDIYIYNCDIIATLTHPELVKNIIDTKSDTSTYAYRHLKSHLEYIQQKYEEVRYIYIFTVIDSKMVFLIEGEPVSSKDYTAPGYQDEWNLDDYYLDNYYDGISYIDGPFIDEWGTWISVASPIYNEEGNVIASLGMDIPDDYWYRELILKRHLTQILTGFALGFLILAITMFNIQRIKNYELGLSESKYRSLFSQSLDAVLVIRPDGSIIDINTNGRQMLGYNQTEISSINFYDILKDNDYNSSALFFDYLADSSDRLINIEIENSEGKNFPVELKAYPVTINEEENIIYIILSDLTQRTAIKEEKEKLEDRIKHMEKMEAIGQLAGGIAHDFNNILTVILGNADIVLSRSNKDIRKYADKIKQASYRGKKLTQHLLTFARKGHYTKEYTDIHSIIEESVEMFRTTFDKRIKIETELHASRSIVLGDPGQLENMIINLGLNARDAIPKQGFIRITTENIPGTEGQNSSIRIVIKDNGVGMDKQTISRAFEPFFTTKEEKKGTGLGLSSVYGTVNKFNGSISVNSEPGMGSEFSIVLPVTKRKYVWKHNEEQPDRSYEANIILIDDEENIRLLAEEFLSSTDYSITTFKNGLRGLSYYKEHFGEIDLVILDIIMPVMSGSETYDKMKEIFPDINILIITGYSVEEQIDKLRKKGVKHFLQKPFDRKELLNMIHKVISP